MCVRGEALQDGAVGAVVAVAGLRQRDQRGAHLAQRGDAGVEVGERSVLGLNFRMNELQGALGLAQLAKLAGNNRRRAALVTHLRAELTGLPGLTVPFGVPAAGRVEAYFFPLNFSIRSKIGRKMSVS